MAGAAITAMPPPRLNWAPGAGQARTTDVTGTECGGRGTSPALSEIGCRRPASAYRPPSTTTTMAADRTRLPRRFLTGHPPPARRPDRGPRPHGHGWRRGPPGRDSRAQGIPCRSTTRGRGRRSRRSQGPRRPRRGGCRGPGPAPRWSRSGPGWTTPSCHRPRRTGRVVRVPAPDGIPAARIGTGRLPRVSRPRPNCPGPDRNGMSLPGNRPTRNCPGPDRNGTAPRYAPGPAGPG